jgi:hypothetical protein
MRVRMSVAGMMSGVSETVRVIVTMVMSMAVRLAMVVGMVMSVEMHLPLSIVRAVYGGSLQTQRIRQPARKQADFAVSGRLVGSLTTGAAISLTLRLVAATIN